MKPADTLERLRRRWYIVLPGLVLAIAAAAGAWTAVGPEYERSGTQLLLPGAGSLPEGETNPFFSIGGLQLPADVLVQSVSGQNALGDLLADYPGAEVVIERAPGSAPLVKTTVSSGDEAQVTRLLSVLLDRNVATLESLQASEGVPESSRIIVTTLTVDTESTLRQRNRMIFAAVAGIGVAVLALVVASLADGLARSRRRRSSPERVRGTREDAANDTDISDLLDDESTDADGSQDAETNPWPRVRSEASSTAAPPNDR